MAIQNNYLEDVIKQFQYYKTLGEKSIEQLTDSALLWKYNHESNSIAVIVNHLAGNMLSRWTDFLKTDGEKEWRNRDQEFEDVIKTREELLTRWDEGWDCLFEALNSIETGQLSKTVFIRNQEHTVIEAINRQLAHYAMHVGQIIYVAKMLKEGEWHSLSIARGQSHHYNQRKLSRGKHGGHFSDDRMKS